MVFVRLPGPGNAAAAVEQSDDPGDDAADGCRLLGSTDETCVQGGCQTSSHRRNTSITQMSDAIGNRQSRSTWACARPDKPGRVCFVLSVQAASQLQETQPCNRCLLVKAT